MQEKRLQSLEDTKAMNFFKDLDFDLILRQGNPAPVIPPITSPGINFNPQFSTFSPQLSKVDEIDINQNVHLQVS